MHHAEQRGQELVGDEMRVGNFDQAARRRALEIFRDIGAGATRAGAHEGAGDLGKARGLALNDLHAANGLGRPNDVEETPPDPAERFIDRQVVDGHADEILGTCLAIPLQRGHEKRLLRGITGVERCLRGRGSLRHEIHRGAIEAELQEGFGGGGQNLLVLLVARPPACPFGSFGGFLY